MTKCTESNIVKNKLKNEIEENKVLITKLYDSICPLLISNYLKSQ